jgi:6-phosphogluconolactonase
MNAKPPHLKHILVDAQDIDEYPAQLIKPVHGQIHWFLDNPASSLVHT